MSPCKHSNKEIRCKLALMQACSRTFSLASGGCLLAADPLGSAAHHEAAKSPRALEQPACAAPGWRPLNPTPPSGLAQRTGTQLSHHRRLSSLHVLRQSGISAAFYTLHLYP